MMLSKTEKSYQSRLPLNHRLILWRTRVQKYRKPLKEESIIR
jgi:hypothetical protein